MCESIDRDIYRYKHGLHRKAYSLSLSITLSLQMHVQLSIDDGGVPPFDKATRNCRPISSFSVFFLSHSISQSLLRISIFIVIICYFPFLFFFLRNYTSCCYWWTDGLFNNLLRLPFFRQTRMGCSLIYYSSPHIGKIKVLS